MRWRPVVGLAVTTLVLAAGVGAPTPARDTGPSQASTGTARLGGRVIAAETGTPIRRAQVRASASAIRMTRLASTDAEGRYGFSNLPAARYTITVSKAGYVGLKFGQKKPFEGGRPLDIANGQTIDEIDFALPRGGVIAGTLVDEDGDPITGAWVSALRYHVPELQLRP